MAPHRESARDAGRLTATQEQIWWLHHSLSASDLLNMFYALRIEGPLDAVALEQALRQVCRRHQPLCTTYPAVDGAPSARIEARPQLAWKAVDLPDDPADLARLAAEEAHRPFDLAGGPLLRATLLRLGPERHVLLLNFHHISADGWSLEVFCRECSALYTGLHGDRVPQLEELEGQCVDHAAWQARWLAGEQARQEADWWRDYLRGVSAAAFTLPTEGARRPGLDFAVSRQVSALPAELTEELGQVARRRGASPYMVFLAALDVLLARWTGQEDVVIGTLTANRETALSSGVLGAHFNPVLMRTDLAGEPCLGEVLMRVVESALPALDHQGLPFPALRGVLGENGVDPAAMPVPAAMLLQDRYPLAGLTLAGSRVTPLHLDEGGAQHPGELAGPRRLHAATAADLTFFLRESGDRQTLSVFYKTRLFDDRSIRQLIAAYSEILLAMVEELESSISDLELTLPSGSGEPVPRVAGERMEPGLFPITTTSPVDALSPVICLPSEELVRSLGDPAP